MKGDIELSQIVGMIIIIIVLILSIYIFRENIQKFVDAILSFKPAKP